MFVSTQTNRISERLDAIGVSAAVACVIAGVSPSAFSNARRGIKALDSQLELKLVNLSVRLTELTDSVAPLRLPSDAPSLSRLLAFVETHQITNETIREAILNLFGDNSSDSTVS